MRSSRAAKLAVSLVSVTRTKPIARLVIVIVALVTAAPDVPVTVPTMLAVVWPYAAAFSIAKPNRTNYATRTLK